MKYEERKTQAERAASGKPAIEFWQKSNAKSVALSFFLSFSSSPPDSHVMFFVCLLFCCFFLLCVFLYALVLVPFGNWRAVRRTLKKRLG